MATGLSIDISSRGKLQDSNFEEEHLKIKPYIKKPIITTKQKPQRKNASANDITKSLLPTFDKVLERLGYNSKTTEPMISV